VAIAILVYGRTHSAFLTALAYSLTYLPPIAGGPLLSGLADLFPRRRVMIACDVLRVGTVGVMAIPGMPFAALCALLFCTVLTGAPFSSARAALLPDVLPGDKFVLGSAVGNITYQASQILGFVAGAAVVAALNPYKTLGIDAVSFGISALIVLTGVKARPSPRREGAARPSLWSVSADGIRIVFGNRMLLSLLLFGWLAGFYIVPEGLAAPYARSLHGGTLTVGLLMAAMPFGMVAGAFLLGRVAAPSARIRMMGWLAVLRSAHRQRVGPPAVGRTAAVDAGRRRRRLSASGGRGIRAGTAALHQGTRLRRGSVRLVRGSRARHSGRRRGSTGHRAAARRRPSRPGRPDRGHHARHGLDAPARRADPGAADRDGYGGRLRRGS
jgi:MFS family permease